MDQLLAQEDVTASLSSADRVLWPLPDHLQTTRDLIDNAGDLREHYQYDSFGQILSGDITLTRYLFTSREHDPATNLNYHRARHYDSAAGRWITEDPIGFVGSDPNNSRYVGNMPTAGVDCAGLQTEVPVASDLIPVIPMTGGNTVPSTAKTPQPWPTYPIHPSGFASTGTAVPGPNFTWDNALLNYYVRVMNEMLSLDYATVGVGRVPLNWEVIEAQIAYFKKHYTFIGPMGIMPWNGSSNNWPIFPGFFIDQEIFYGETSGRLEFCYTSLATISRHLLALTMTPSTFTFHRIWRRILTLTILTT